MILPPDRFLGRLLLVHGTLADYRLGRLIKYSFYKNISFASMFFFFQFFNGWSGQARAHRLAAKAWLCIIKCLRCQV